jgi:hypothetical protein
MVDLAIRSRLVITVDRLEAVLAMEWRQTAVPVAVPPDRWWVALVALLAARRAVVVAVHRAFTGKAGMVVPVALLERRRPRPITVLVGVVAVARLVERRRVRVRVGIS